MAIDLSKRTFGKTTGTAAAASADSRPKAQLWANLGYMSNVQDEDGSYRFVSLATGIPLDTMEDLPTNSKNRDYAFFQQARNQLKSDIVEEAMKLAPGESIILEGGDHGLCIQLRRVGEEVAAPTGENPFARPKAA